MNYKEKFDELVKAQRYEEARALLEEKKGLAYEESFYFANMGWVLNHIGRHQEAMSYLQKGIQTFPDDAWMYSQLGYAYNHNEQSEEAIKYLLKGLSMGHDEPWIHSELGWAYRQLKDYKNAIEYFENALLYEPDNIWVLAQAAFTYRDMDQKENAEEYLKKVYELSPDDDSIFDLAMFYKQERRYADEVEILNKVQDEQFMNWRDFEIAFAYNRMEKEQEAIQLLEACLARGRDDTGLREELADAYRRCGNTEEAAKHYQVAINYFEKALTKNEPDAYWILQDMTWIAHKQDDIELKLKYLDRMYEMKQDDPWVLYHFTKSHSHLGNYEKALHYCELCMQAEGKSIELLSLKAWNLGKMDQVEQALELLNEVEKLGRDDEWIYNEMGWDYSEIKDYEKAIEYYEKALALNDQDAWTYSQLAWNEDNAGKYLEALSHFKQAEALGRNDGWLYANIGWVYTHLNNYKMAVHYFEIAKNLDFQDVWFLKKYEIVEIMLKQEEEDAKKKKEGSSSDIV